MEEKIKMILEEVIDNPEVSSMINNETNIISDIGIDSLKMISFIVKVEEELNVYIDFEKFSYDHLTSIDKFAKFLDQCEKVNLNS